MSFRIEETFTVHAPAERVWRYLIDPRQVVECLPGAELTEAVGEREFLGRVKVKVGPVTAAYAGKAQLVEVDDAARRVRISAEGRESAGAGSAKMTMTSTVAALADGGSEVRVEAQLDVAGKIVQFGRGMIDTVNRQLFTQFTACVRSRLEVAEAARPVAGEGAEAPGAAPGPPGAGALAQGEGGAAPPSGAPAFAPADATRVAAGAGARGEGSAPLPRQAEPVRVLPLLFRALWEWLRGLFRRRAHERR